MKKVSNKFLNLSEISTGLYALMPQPSVRFNITNINKTDLKSVKEKDFLNQLFEVENIYKSTVFDYSWYPNIEDEMSKIKQNKLLTKENNVLEKTRFENSYFLEKILKESSFSNKNYDDFKHNEEESKVKKMYYITKYKMNYDALVKSEIDKTSFILITKIIDEYPEMVNILDNYSRLDTKVVIANALIKEKQNVKESNKSLDFDDENFDITIHSNIVKYVTKTNSLIYKNGVVMPKYTTGYNIRTMRRDDPELLSGTFENPWISWSSWGKGGVEEIEALIESEVKISWEDINSMMAVNKFKLEKTRLKKIILIPEITVVNPPVNMMRLRIYDYDVKFDKTSVSKGRTKKYFSFPKSFEESYWTVSDIIKILADVFEIASVIPMTGKISMFFDTVGKIKKTIESLNFDPLNTFLKTFIPVEKRDSYDSYSDYNNTIVLDVNKKMERGKEISLSLNKMNFRIGRSPGYYFDTTEVSLNRFFVKFIFEEDKN